MWEPFYLNLDVLNLQCLEQNGSPFADNIGNCIFVNRMICNLIQMSLKVALKCPIDNKSALVQVSVCHWNAPG